MSSPCVPQPHREPQDSPSALTDSLKDNCDDDFHSLHPRHRPSVSKTVLEGVEKAFSFVPNLQGNMAESAELLAGYSQLWNLFGKSTLTPQEQQGWRCVN